MRMDERKTTAANTALASKAPAVAIHSKPPSETQRDVNNNNHNHNSITSEIKNPSSVASTVDNGSDMRADGEMTAANVDGQSGKEMLAGCSVCGDDDGSVNNQLVYCDGPECQVAVHQACYGIGTVPAGEWLCRLCEHKCAHAAQDKETGRCVLCGDTDGAMKLTDTGKWAHVVCALYIPEISFGSHVSMEPILLGAVHTERYQRRCTLCESKGLYDDDATTLANTAVVQCNKPGCKHWFHVTW